MSVSKLLSLLPALDARRSAETIAAVDLGSNSFHLVVAQADDGKIRVIDRLQEMVRLAAGLDARNRLSGPARQRALDCLARFGERLRGLPGHAVRAVGTNTLRRARDADKFLRRAERALGHPIEIISGQEEARVIYQGVARELPDDGERRLVLDIGGGSTELIIGEGRRALLTESLSLGCVTLSRAHFATGRITPKALSAAETGARLELQPIEAQFRTHGWTAAYGSSGTLRAVASVIETQRWGDHGITPATLKRLRDALLAAGHVDQLALAGLSPERAPVFPGGLAILAAVFEALGIERMRVSGGALREGLLYDLVGRIRHEDVREQTIRDLSARYQVDVRQAERVAATAQRCLAQVAADWQLDEADGRMLAWGARLHEIGLAIAHNKYHRHGAYLVENSNLPGFSWQEQRLLAALIRGHRRRLPRDLFDALPRAQRRSARRLCLLLRLAVLLHRGRGDVELPALRLEADKRSLMLRFPRGWLGRHPLTREDLVREAVYLQAARLELLIR
ncbi:MAG TPA: exopolyphosphatase [Acidiferrobacterales bacterium]